MKEATPTTSEILQHFSQYLHNWSEERLRQKRGPFRQAELCRGLFGAEELPSLPLVYWVNRESLLAGGIVIIPDRSDEDLLPAASNAAQALGLANFFTWGRHEIRCWLTGYNPPEQIWEYDLPFGKESSPSEFRKCFNLLIDQMEKQFFALQSAGTYCTAPYLANLINVTYHDLYPIFQKTSRLAIADGQYAPESVPLKNNLLQLLLLPVALTIVKCDLQETPGDDLPEQIIGATRKLAEECGSAFSMDRETFFFPRESQRRFQHYLNRLRQLAAALPDIIADAVSMVLQRFSGELGGHRLPETESSMPLVAINPDSSGTQPSPVVEIAPSGIAAANALIRKTSGNNPALATSVYTNPFELKSGFENHLLAGSLTDDRIPDVTRQKELNTRLRFSWPNHKISLSGKTPTWAWELLHLAGLLGKGSRLELLVPKNWLWDQFGEKIPEILVSKLVFSEISLDTSSCLKCVLQQPGETISTTIKRGSDPQRIIEPPRPRWLRPLTIIALFAPDSMFHLLETDDLKFYDEEACREFSPAGLQHYLQSSLGRSFWTLLAPGRSLPRPDKLAALVSRAGVPLPGETVLRALGQINLNKRDVTTADIDQELAVWLGATTPIQKDSLKKSARKTSPEATEENQLFFNACLKEEIPVFPENYIYKIPESQRLVYEFSGRLKIQDVFFEEVILADPEQNKFTVRGIRQAEALEIASTCRPGPVELPCDQAETEKMLARYLNDLARLRKTYYRHATDLLTDQEVTETVNTFWNKQALPDWQMVKSLTTKTF